MKAFEDIWNFPNCCGAVDGKHVLIRRPPNSTSEFFNYKGTYSIVLLAVVDADYCFRYIDVGSDGRASDSTIFQTSTFNCALEQNLLNWPEGGVLVGDDIFPLGSNLLKPYAHRKLTLQERIFNYRLSRARRVVENAFGILSSRFRVFNTPIALKVDTAELLTKACCSIHNWLRMTASPAYLPPGSVDEEDIITGQLTGGSWRDVPTTLSPMEKQYKSNNYAQDGEDVRNAYSYAFMSHMAVPWQKKAVGLSK